MVGQSGHVATRDMESNGSGAPGAAALTAPMRAEAEQSSQVATGVVVGVDDSASARAAVAWAATAADRRGVGLHLVEVLPGSSEPSPGAAAAAAGIPHGRARALLARAQRVARAACPQVTVSMHTLSGPVGPTLVAYAAEASLLVLGSNGPGGPIPLSLGSILGEVTRHCLCPVVLVPHTARSHALRADGPVLVALEDTPDGERAVAFAAEAAHRRGVALTPLVTAHESVPDPAGGEPALPASLADIRRRYPDLMIHPQVITTPPADALLAADTEAAMLVVPSRPRRPSRDRPTAGWTGHFLPILATCPVGVVSIHTRPSTTLA